MKDNFNIAIVGLGQIGIYLLNQLNKKKKRYRTKNWKKDKYSCSFSKEH